MQKFLGFLVVAAIVGGIIWYFMIGTLPGLNTVMGDLVQAKQDSERMASTLKREWNSRQITDPQYMAYGRNLYESARAKFAGCIQALDIGLITGWQQNSMLSFSGNLQAANQEYRSFKAWFDQWHANRPGVQSTDAPPPPVDLFKWVEKLLPAIQDGAKRLYDDFQSKTEQDKAYIRQNLVQSNWVAWDYIQ